jgi:hypothetical protein
MDKMRIVGASVATDYVLEICGESTWRISRFELMGMLDKVDQVTPAGHDANPSGQAQWQGSRELLLAKSFLGGER